MKQPPLLDRKKIAKRSHEVVCFQRLDSQGTLESPPSLMATRDGRVNHCRLEVRTGGLAYQFFSAVFTSLENYRCRFRTEADQ
jgi:hypothetical protein